MTHMQNCIYEVKILTQEKVQHKIIIVRDLYLALRLILQKARFKKGEELYTR